VKSKTQFVCTECSASYSKWQGRCNGCGAWNSLEEQTVVREEIKASKGILSAAAEVTDLATAVSNPSERISTKFAELDLVLSGGLVDRQVILFSGEPGIGKSTLLLQLAVKLHSEENLPCLYVSGEESAGQVASRAARLFSKKEYAGVSFIAAPGVRQLIDEIERLKPEVVIVDSIQTIFDEDVNSLPGSLAQVKACTAGLVRAAKQIGFILVIVGHINKEGTIAGPKVLEHLVDTVLQFEGEREGEFRLIRTLKNRFGSTGEVGVMIMTEKGLADMQVEDNLFAGRGNSGVGTAAGVVLEGNRPLIVQVQALTNKTIFPYPKRIAEGISISRLQLICAILDKFAGTDLGSYDVYLRTAGGFKLVDVQTDLAIAAAIISSYKNIPIDEGLLFVGEIGLNGRVMLSKLASSKLKNVSKLGVNSIVMPHKTVEGGKLPITQVEHLNGLNKALRN